MYLRQIAAAGEQQLAVEIGEGVHRSGGDSVMVRVVRLRELAEQRVLPRNAPADHPAVVVVEVPNLFLFSIHCYCLSWRGYGARAQCPTAALGRSMAATSGRASAAAAERQSCAGSDGSGLMTPKSAGMQA